MEIIPAQDIMNILQEEYIVAPIYLNQEQDDTYPCLTIRRYGGEANPRWARDQVLIQVRCKGDVFGSQEAEQLIYKVRDILLGLDTVEYAAEYDYVRFLVISDVSYIGTDDNNRPVFTVNFETTIDWKIPIGNRLPIN